MKKIIVLAGNRREFEFFLDYNGMTDSEAVYGYCPEIMAGIEANIVEITGTFWDLKNAGKLEEYARSRIRS